MNIENLKLIGQGNTAEIYEYAEKKILKLFRTGIPYTLAKSEYEKALFVQSYINNVPKAYELLELDNRVGIVYDRVYGTDMIKIMTSSISKINFYSKQLAHYHYDIHKVKVDTTYSLADKLYNDITNADGITDVEKAAIKEYLKDLPNGNSLCHFDFHPGNIMISDNSPIIIDWMTSCAGASSADVARTWLLMKHGELMHVPLVMRKILGIQLRHIGKVYMKEYLKLSASNNQDIQKWILPVAAARLTEWLTDCERQKLIKLVRRKLAEI